MYTDIFVSIPSESFIAMKTCLRSQCLLTLLGLCLCFPAQSFAATLTDIVNDMSPLEGAIVEVNGQQIILNLGSTAGIHKNDLFTVFNPGHKLTDPKTGKVLGQIESRTGVISVTRVEKAFSFASPVGKIGRVQRGDKLVRFKELTATAKDQTGSASHFMFELQQRLQFLNWQDTPSTDVELTFLRENDMLKVQNNQGKLIREYQIANTAQQSATSSGIPAGTVVYAAAAVAPAAVAVSSNEGNPKVRYDLKTYGYNHAGSLPFSATMGDFLMIDNVMYLVTIQENTLAVFVIEGKTLRQVATRNVPLVKQLSVCWWQPAGGSPYIGVTGYDTDEQVVSSAVYRFNKKTITPVNEGLASILNSSDIDGDGLPETMLAQDFDQDVFYGRNVHQLTLSGSRVTTRPYDRALPRTFRVAGGTLFKQNAQSPLVAAYVAGSKLHIIRDKREVYVSSKEMGGSASAIRYEQNPGDLNPLFSTAKIELRPIAVDIDNDGIREILVPSADLSAFTTVGGANNIKNSWLSVIKPTDAGTYMKGKIGGSYDQYIQALGAGNGAVYLLTVNPSGLLSQDQGGSQLLVLPLQD